MSPRALILHDGDAVDLLLLTPLLRALAQRSGAAVLVASSCSQAPQLLAAHPHVAACMSLPAGGLLGRFDAQVRALRRRLHDAATNTLVWAIGTGAERFAAAINAAVIALPAAGPGEHRSIWALRAAAIEDERLPTWQPMSDALLDPRAQLAWTAEPGDQLVLATGAGRWGQWQHLPGLLPAGRSVVAIGSQARELAAAAAHVSCEDDEQRWPQLLAACGCCIGEDEWPLHAAAACARPVVLLPLQRHPRSWRPLGPAVEMVSPLPVDQVPDGDAVWQESCRPQGISPRMVAAAYAKLMDSR